MKNPCDGAYLLQGSLARLGILERSDAKIVGTLREQF